MDTGLIKSTVITGGTSIAAFANGVGLPVGITLSGTSLLLSLATVISRKSFKTSKLLAQSKLDNMADIILQTMQDGDISFIEFHKVLRELVKYRKLMLNIRNQDKAKVKTDY